MEHSFSDKVKTFYFLAAAMPMYYFLSEVLNLGVFVTYRHVFALVLAASAMVSFLAKPNIARGVTAVKAALVYSVPLLVTLVTSLFIWFVSQVETAVMARGLSGAFIYTNMLSFALAAAAFLYMFGEKGIWYNLTAMVAANILMIVIIIVQNGLGNYLTELITLVKTFAAETGDIIVQAEVHELAFCLGAYLIYMLLKPQKNKAIAVLFALSVFCFLSAFKRIGIIAIIVALFFGLLLKWIAKYSEKTAVRLMYFFTFLMIGLLLGYIGLIKSNAFSVLEQLGIDTSGRAGVYNAVDKYYTFSPSFLGNGIGFLTYQLNSRLHVGVSAVHNDFLQYFIDLGFWGYLAWLVSMTLVRIRYFGSGGRTQDAVVTFSLLLYLIIVSATDNTMNYPLLTMTLAVLMIGGSFNEKVRDTEIKLFGSASAPNR